MVKRETQQKKEKEIFLIFEYMYEKTNPKTTNTMITDIMIPL